MANFQGVEDFMNHERSFIPYNSRTKYIINPKLPKLPNVRVLGTDSRGVVIGNPVISRDLYNPFGMNGTPILFKSIAGGSDKTTFAATTTPKENWNYDFDKNGKHIDHISTIANPSVYTIPAGKDLVIFSCPNPISCLHYVPSTTDKYWCKIRTSNSISSVIPGITQDGAGSDVATKVMIDMSGSHAFSIPETIAPPPGSGDSGNGGGSTPKFWDYVSPTDTYGGSTYIPDRDQRLMTWSGMLVNSGSVTGVEPIMGLSNQDYDVPVNKDLVITSSGFGNAINNATASVRGGVYLVDTGVEFLLREPDDGIMDPTRQTHHFWDSSAWLSGSVNGLDDYAERSGSLTPSIIPSGSKIRVRDSRGGWCGYLLESSVYSS
tara:strand:- start:186 stop:1316 length:1131 start_codon:yes stop_codon:yes gene_type:complete